MMYSLVVHRVTQGIPVARSCRVLGFSKQALYAWNTETKCQHDGDDPHLVNAARNVHA